MSVHELSFRLPREPDSVAEARRLVRDVLATWGIDGALAGTVALLVSELVTNAVLYGAPPIDLTLDFDDAALRAEVRDGADRMPEQAVAPRGRGNGGYGLRIVEQLAHDWGVERHGGGGKSVWFAIERGPRPS